MKKLDKASSWRPITTDLTRQQDKTLPPNKPETRIILG
jgi:hypothetical protein